MSVRHRFGAVAVPLTYTAAAVALGVVVPRVEAALLPDLSLPISAGSATAVLSAIASGTLPLTGLVFSLAFVMVQFSATAYSPRLVAWLAGSALMSHSLGIFTATFIYALAALPWVDRGGTGKVPVLTVWLAILLLLASVVVFVLLIERLTMLKISRVLAYAGDLGRTVIARDYAKLEAAGHAASLAAELPAVSQVLVHEGGPAAVQSIDVPRLVALAERENVVLELAWAVGDTIVEGMPLLRVRGGGRPVAEDRLRPLVRLGHERTFEQDPKYAIRILVDIAIKALSPAINDPTTAVQALDQVEDLLLRLARVDLKNGRVADAQGQPPARLPGAELGGLPGAGLRRDPLLRRELDPGHAPAARAAAGADGARAAGPAAGTRPLPRAGRRRDPPHVRGRSRQERRAGGGPPGPRPQASATTGVSMRGKGRVTLVLAVLTVLVLAASVPGSLREAWERGGFYLFSRDFLLDLPKRLFGPGRFRFLLQPAIATAFGIAAGRRDAGAGRAPYLYGLLFGSHARRDLVRSAAADIINLVLMGILVDSVCQWLILGASYPGAALLVGPLLIAGPYSVARALANRLATARESRRAR